MNNIKAIIDAAVKIFNMQFNLFGFTISFMGIFVASCLIVIIGRLIWGLFK